MLNIIQYVSWKQNIYPFKRGKNKDVSLSNLKKGKKKKRYARMRFLHRDRESTIDYRDVYDYENRCEFD